MTLFNLKDKNAIITGSSRGIGKAIAYRMAEHGAKVIITSRKLDACEAVAKEINDTFGEGHATAISCNISDKEQLKNLYKNFPFKTLAITGTNGKTTITGSAL